MIIGRFGEPAQNGLPPSRKADGTQYILFNEDCIAGMRKLPSNEVDRIVTSPPYNLGIKYGKYDDRKSKLENLDWTLRWATEAHRVLKEKGSLFLNVGASPSNPMLPHEIMLKLSKLFVLQNTFHWIKAITIKTKDGVELSAGHFKPIHSKRFVTNCHEYVFHLTKTGNTRIDRLAVGVPYADKSNIARWSHTQGIDRRCRGNTWYIPYPTIQNRQEERPHPATFPKELPIQCIRLHGGGADLVMLDPFLGLGNSALAAQECGIKTFIGYEIDAAYVAIAKRRLRDG